MEENAPLTNQPSTNAQHYNKIEMCAFSFDRCNFVLTYVLSLFYAVRNFVVILRFYYVIFDIKCA